MKKEIKERRSRESFTTAYFTDGGWLSIASTFQLGLCSMYKRAVELQRYEQMDGSLKWAVKMDSWVLGSDSHWYWQPMPSGRTDEFLNLCRFETKEDAHREYIYHLFRGKVHQLFADSRSEVLKAPPHEKIPHP